MDSELKEKAQVFRALHDRDKLFVMPNAWDAGSAKLLAGAGFAAIATTSGGVNWSKGRRDYVYEVTRDEMLSAYGEIAGAVDLPVSGDLENGYGDNPEDVAESIRQAMRFGMVGGGIEDSTADPACPLFDLEVAVERIRAARAAADASQIEFTITARSEAFCVGHPEPLKEAIVRANRYRQAGADCIFIPGPEDRQTIRTLVGEIDAPLSHVVGLGDGDLTVEVLADLGIRRVSTGGSLARACYGLLQRAARSLLSEGSYEYAQDAISDADINAFLGKHNV